MAVYLDHNAGAPVRPEAAAAAAEALAAGGNPSSVHAAGRTAHARLEGARAVVGEAVGARASDVVFTAGATEALHLAVHSVVRAGSRRLLASAIEHDAALAAAQGAGVAVDIAPVGADGVVDVAWLSARLAGWNAEADGPPAVALMLINNETGVVQPVAEVGRLARAAGGRLITDAVQALGKIPVARDDLNADYLVVTSHKIGGAPGAGALIASPDAPISAQITGGGQERGRRAGTENGPGIAGFAAAVEASLRDRDQAAALAVLRDDLEARVRAARPEAVVFGAGAPRAANTSCFALPGFPADTQVMALDLAGVAVSAGSACSSGKVRESHVLRAMGVAPDLARCAIRVSLGWTTAPADVDAFIEAWTRAADRAAPRRAA